MSKNYVKAVLDYLPALTSPTDSSVLVAIAEYTSDETRLAWPSIRALERRTRLSERAVQYSLRRLESQRLISTTLGGQDDRSRNTASCYRLEFDHRGQPLDYKAAPKRALHVEPAAPARSAPQAQDAPPARPYVPRPSVKKIATGDSSHDLSAERTRQLAALRKKIAP